MRERIREMRRALVDKLQRARAGRAISDFVLAAARHVLVFRPDQGRRCARLREDFSIYAVDTGRICVAALNSRNIDYVANAIATVICADADASRGIVPF